MFFISIGFGVIKKYVKKHFSKNKPAIQCRTQEPVYR